ncbi:hypothetical protein [Yoonia sp. R2-816]|uniref:hypothetical protein n=1 Tax=Yoonia sp. R2-816 TaxID=3342638 RepID=UPI00372770DA
MAVWRLAQSIQIKTLGLASRDGCLLVAEVYNDDGTIKGVRPLARGAISETAGKIR